jgi:hypothetical protein
VAYTLKDGGGGGGGGGDDHDHDHYGMTRPRVASEGYGLQICKGSCEYIE